MANYFKQLQSIYPEIHNFEDAVTDDKYFSTCGHMNKAGAEEFSRIVYKPFLNPNQRLEKNCYSIVFVQPMGHYGTTTFQIDREC